MTKKEEEKLQIQRIKEEFKQLEAYRKSEENIKACEPFEQLNQKYILIYEKYANLFNELSCDIESEVCRRAYASGGLGFHRGALSPSQMDLVVIGEDRGRLLKRTPKNDRYNYEYLFDKEDKLICVYCYNDVHVMASVELLIYEQDKVLALEYCADDYRLVSITECQYEENKLMRYEHALCSHLTRPKGCSQIRVEILEYDENDLMKSFDWCEYLPGSYLLDHYKYTFTRDEEGYLYSCKIKQIGGYKPSLFIDRSDMDNIICKKKRRK